MVRHLNTNYECSRKKFEVTKSCISNMHDDFIHLITQVEESINPEYANEIKLLTVGVLAHLRQYDWYAYGWYEVDGELTSTPSSRFPLISSTCGIIYYTFIIVIYLFENNYQYLYILFFLIRTLRTLQKYNSWEMIILLRIHYQHHNFKRL